MKTFRIELDDENNPMDLEAARFEAQIVERERLAMENNWSKDWLEKNGFKTGNSNLDAQNRDDSLAKLSSDEMDNQGTDFERAFRGELMAEMEAEEPE